MSELRRKIAQRVPAISWRDKKLRDLDGRLAKNQKKRAALSAELNAAKQELAAQKGDLNAVDAQLGALQQQRDSLEDSVKAERRRRRAPSFEALLSSYAAQHQAALQLSNRDLSPMAQIPFKLRNYSLAQSHGVTAPEIYGVWRSAREVDLSVVDADRVVLKGDGGHSAQGVFPLERTADGWRTVDGEIGFAGDLLPEDLQKTLGKARSPFFAEQFLVSPSGWTIPEDVKLYCAYGEVLQIYVMRSSADSSMDRKTFSSRFFDASGAPLEEIRNGLNYDHSIDAPQHLPELVEAARHLSRAVGMPFMRVDMYSTAAGPVLGELTAVPSAGVQSYATRHDRAMGKAWVEAQARLEHDLMRGRPFGTLYGSHEYTWWYPEARDKDNMHRPDNWHRRQASCGEWCFTSPQA